MTEVILENWDDEVTFDGINFSNLRFADDIFYAANNKKIALDRHTLT